MALRDGKKPVGHMLSRRLPAQLESLNKSKVIWDMGNIISHLLLFSQDLS